MKLKNPTLWARIQAFDIDDSNAAFPFSKKLAHQQGWSADFTVRAISEYRRFVYLCCTEPNGASPSPIVDEVWHLHLTYTQNYWDEFCTKILQKPLHHHPSKGGTDERARHDDWYENTLAAYQNAFLQDPPDDIWVHPKAAIIDIPTKWTVADFQNAMPYIVGIYLGILLFLPILLRKSHIFALTGMQFLAVYTLIAALICIPIAVWVLPELYKTVLADYLRTNPLPIDSYDFTYFEGGEDGVTKLAIADAMGSGFLAYDANTKKFMTTENGTPHHLLQRALRGEYKSEHLYSTAKSALQSIATKWEVVSNEVEWRFFSPLFAMLMVEWCIGWARMIQGVSNGKPVEILLFLQIFYAFFVLLPMYNMATTAFKKHIFAYLQQDKTSIQNVLTSQQGLAYENDGTLRLAQYGFSDMAVLFATTSILQPTESDNNGGGGCSGGGGGCSGGGCGGGCGGCGG